MQATPPSCLVLRRIFYIPCYCLESEGGSTLAAQLCQDSRAPGGRYFRVQTGSAHPRKGDQKAQKGSLDTWVEHHPEPITLILNSSCTRKKWRSFLSLVFVFCVFFAITRLLNLSFSDKSFQLGILKWGRVTKCSKLAFSGKWNCSIWRLGYLIQRVIRKCTSMDYMHQLCLYCFLSPNPQPSIVSEARCP